MDDPTLLVGIFTLLGTLAGLFSTHLIERGKTRDDYLIQATQLLHDKRFFICEGIATALNKVNRLHFQIWDITDRESGPEAVRKVTAAISSLSCLEELEHLCALANLYADEELARQLNSFTSSYRELIHNPTHAQATNQIEHQDDLINTIRRQLGIEALSSNYIAKLTGPER